MIRKEIEQLLKPTIEDLGCILWGCEYISQGKHSLLRVYIDKDDGIQIDDCERVSHQVSALLDVEDPIPANYRLEVSSPGIPRPLFHPWQYEKYIGQEIQIKLFKPVAGKRQIKGILLAVNENSIILEFSNEQQEFLFANIVKAFLTVE